MTTQAEQDLAIIRQLMEEGRRLVVDRGVHFMVWGVISAIGLTATYTSIVMGVGPDPQWVWAGLLVVGWTASLVTGWRADRGARVSTLARRLMSATWISAGVSLTLVALAGMFGPVVHEVALPGLLSVVIAAPVLMTWLLTGQGWLAWVGTGWWVGGAVMLFAPGVYMLPLMAVMSVVLMAVPGGVLFAMSRQ